MQNIVSPRGGPGDSEIVKPTTSNYDQHGFNAAELHFQRFPSSRDESGHRIYTLATASAGGSAILQQSGGKSGIAGVAEDISEGGQTVSLNDGKLEFVLCSKDAVIQGAHT